MKNYKVTFNRENLGSVYFNEEYEALKCVQRNANTVERIILETHDDVLLLMIENGIIMFPPNKEGVNILEKPLIFENVNY